MRSSPLVMPVPSNSVVPATVIREKLDDLRTQLVDLAFALERRGQMEAADVAIATSCRVGELCDELEEEPG